MPAAGFALDLDNLSWALRIHGREEELEARVLVALGPRSAAVCAALRARGVGCAAAAEGDLEAFARAWGFSHVLRAATSDKLTLWEASTAGAGPGALGVVMASSHPVPGRRAARRGNRES